MTQLIVGIGNIGTGKSLIASKLAKKGFTIVSMDSIQTMFSGGEYGLYDLNKKDLYLKTETIAIKTALVNGISVFIDRTNIDIKRRKRFLEIGKQYASEVLAYDWGPGNCDDLYRRINNSRGVPKQTWQSVYEYMQKSYEYPTKEEGFDQIIYPPTKFKFHAFDFDGTIVKGKFPEIGEIINGTLDKMNMLWTRLSNIIIIWTCRYGDYENQMRAFLLKNNIPFDFINENPIFSTNSSKIFAHKYYDDRAITMPKENSND